MRTLHFWKCALGAQKRRKMSGKFITFEGCEGVGKSSQIRRLKNYLDENKIECVVTREPGGNAISEKIRGIILDSQNKEMCDICETLLYAAARAQHINDIIKPNLKAGKLVICDRYTDSTYAYQGSGKGLGKDFINQLNQLSVNGVNPDLTIFLDLEPVEAFKRKGGADKNDRLENLSIDFHQLVYLGYKEIEKNDPGRFCAIDASGTALETHAKIIELLKSKNII